MNRADDILDTIASRKTSGESFVLATVVRTVAATAVARSACAPARSSQSGPVPAPASTRSPVSHGSTSRRGPAPGARVWRENRPGELAYRRQPAGP